MLKDVLVNVSVWLALAGWFAGSMARTLHHRLPNTAAEAVYRIAWLFGSILIVIHILASYGLVHGWSHAAAVQATALESEQVTGIRAGWGVYVNFLFAFVWFCYSLAMVMRRRRWPGVDSAVFWFTLLIVFSATIVFETGVVRLLSMAGFTCLAIISVWPTQTDVDAA